MHDQQCVRFLQEWLPRIGLRWAGYRKVRRTVCKRIARRVRALGLADTEAYAAYLASHAEEVRTLLAFCRIPISRFYRDRGVYRLLESELLPTCAAAAEARSDATVRCWSAGCASGEEPYTIRLVWDLAIAERFPGIGLDIVATDADDGILRRAAAALYGAGSLEELPCAYRVAAFDQVDGDYRIKPAFRHGIRFEWQDICSVQPDGPFDIVFCRNIAFTYFDESNQRAALRAITRRLRPGGYLVIGAHEHLPEETGRALQRYSTGMPVFRRCGGEAL